MNKAEEKIQEVIDWFNANEGATWEDFYRELEKAKHADLNEDIEDMAAFSLEDHTLQEWRDKFNSFTLKNCGSSESDLIAYQTYQMLVDNKKIDMRYQLPLLIDLYVYYGVDDTFNKYLIKALKAEPKDIHEQRLADMRKELVDNIDEHDMVTLYRGHFRRVDAKRRLRHENSMAFDKAVSFSASKEEALWFANRWKLAFKDNGKQMEYKVTTVKIPLEDIAYYTNDREEYECIVKPLSKGGRIEIIEEELI